jgi:hypothetical protein
MPVERAVMRARLEELAVFLDDRTAPNSGQVDPPTHFFQQ